MSDVVKVRKHKRNMLKNARVIGEYYGEKIYEVPKGKKSEAKKMQLKIKAYNPATGHNEIQIIEGEATGREMGNTKWVKTEEKGMMVVNRQDEKGNWYYEDEYGNLNYE